MANKIENEKLKTLTITQLIQVLLQYQKELGDVPVYHQRDEEGNGYGTIDSNSICYDNETEVGKAVFIGPYQEYIEDELFSF